LFQVIWISNKKILSAEFPFKIKPADDCP